MAALLALAGEDTGASQQVDASSSPETDTVLSMRRDDQYYWESACA